MLLRKFIKKINSNQNYWYVYSKMYRLSQKIVDEVEFVAIIRWAKVPMLFWNQLDSCGWIQVNEERKPEVK
jgi:hypothetical protein